MRINTNILSINAQRNLSETSRGLQRALERLSSGSRINRAGDDAAGLAIATGIEADVRGLRQATRNINDAFGFLTTAEGAIRIQTEIVQRMRELALQASNGTIGSTERSFLNTELQELQSEFDRIARQTSFNGSKVLDESRSFQLQVGNSRSDHIDIALRSTRSHEIFTKTEIVPTGVFAQSDQNETLGFSATTSKTADESELLVSYVQSSSTLRFYQASGDGGLEEIQNLAVGSSASLSPEFYDLDGDGKDELLFMDNTGLRIFEADEEGVWSQTQAIAGADDYDVGDIDGDGYLDLAARDGSNVSTYVNDSLNSFSLLETIAGAFNTGGATGRHGSSVSLLDLNGNGRADLGFFTQEEGFGFGADTLQTYLSDENGEMTFAASTLVGDGAQVSGKADIDNDGQMDLVLNATFDFGSNISSYLSDGDGSFTTPTEGPLSPRPAGIFADLDGDGLSDFIQSNGIIRLNEGGGRSKHQPEFYRSAGGQSKADAFSKGS